MFIAQNTFGSATTPKEHKETQTYEPTTDESKVVSAFMNLFNTIRQDEFDRMRTLYIDLPGNDKVIKIMIERIPNPNPQENN